MNEKIFESFNIEDILEPKDNYSVLMNMFWVVKDGKVFRNTKTKIWQCNKFKSTIEDVIKSYPGCEVKYLDYAYVPKE